MSGIIIGFILFLVLGLVVALGVLLVNDSEAIQIGIVTSFAIFGSIFGAIVDAESSEQYVEKYIVTKATIEESLNAEVLSGFERVELVKQATEHNRSLAGRKHTASKWYGFLEDDRIHTLDYIDLSGEGGGDG